MTASRYTEHEEEEEEEKEKRETNIFFLSI